MSESAVLNKTTIHLTRDMQIKIWDVNTGKVLATLLCVDKLKWIAWQAIVIMIVLKVQCNTQAGA